MAGSVNSQAEPTPLTDWVSMPAVLLTGPTVRYTELAVSSLAIASTHFAYQQRDGQVELALVAWSSTKTCRRSLISVLTWLNVK